MVAPALQLAAPSPDVDQRVILSGVTWEDYQRLLAARGDASVPRFTYLRGDLEIRSPGQRHESDKKKLARLLEAYLDQLGIRADGAGSWTVRRQREHGAEADECYVIDRTLDGDEDGFPDLAIEVVYTSGGLDKLTVWAALGVREVWFWTGGALAIYVRAGTDEAEAWRASARSELLPAIDPALLVRCMATPSQFDAVRALRAALTGSR